MSAFSPVSYKITPGETNPDMLEDIKHLRLKTIPKNDVSIWVYPAIYPFTQVLIYHRGSKEIPYAINSEIEALSNGRSRVVIAVDLVEYRADDALATTKYDQIVYQYAMDAFPSAQEVVYFCKSVGNLAWGHCIQFPKVTKVVACVPFRDAHTVVEYLRNSGRYIFFDAQSFLTAVQYIGGNETWTVSPADPAERLSLENAIHALDAPAMNKSVLLMNAREDDLVNVDDVYYLAAQLKSKGIMTKIMTLNGTHLASPFDQENRPFAAEMETLFTYGL